MKAENKAFLLYSCSFRSVIAAQVMRLVNFQMRSHPNDPKINPLMHHVSYMAHVMRKPVDAICEQQRFFVTWLI